MSTVDEVKQKTDIVDIVGQYVKLRKSGRNFSGLCPFHNEKTPSFFVFPERQSWHCFGACATGGDVISFVMKKEGMEFREALRLLASRAGIEIPDFRENQAKSDEKKLLYRLNEEAAAFYHEQLLHSPAAATAGDYLQKRGILSETIVSFRLGYSPNGSDHLKKHLLELGYQEADLLKAGLIIEKENGASYDRFRNKIIFPIANTGGQICGFGSRVLDNSQPKYINSPQTSVFDKSANLYAIDHAKSEIRKQDLAVVVEGYMDALSAHEKGFRNVIAAMGTALGERQLEIIRKISKHVMIAFDADVAGREATLRGATMENITGSEIRVILLPEAKDPDNIFQESPDTWQELVNTATPIMDHLFQTVTAKLDLTRAQDKAVASEQLLPVIRQMQNAVRRSHYLQKLAQLVGVDPRQLDTPLKTSQRRRRATPVSHKQTSFHPIEEYCLALMLNHPEIISENCELKVDYFISSEHREIFQLFTSEAKHEIDKIREKVSPEICECLDQILKMEMPPDKLEEKFHQSVLRLREDYLRRLEMGKATQLAVTTEESGNKAALAMLKEQGIDLKDELLDVFLKKAKGKAS
jgi:DNA primase